ncbi:nucleoside phosphorylase domain-containing protein [Xylogone sp. PMI_703]|nr:nucleoside phosphorylase domain-containing protein [Xylogone sp. PMI_703]
MRPVSRDGFEIAIICALTLEADAVEALFDETYDKFGRYYGKQPGDESTYITGKIGRHNVVLCYLPGMGKVSAAGVAANLRVSYTRIQLALVVGICGAVPFSSNGTEIILGDVIISDSVIQYDFGRQYPDGFQRKSDVKEILGRPNQEIRSLLAGLNGRKTRKEFRERVRQHLSTLQGQSKTEWQHPGIVYDVLFEASYHHKHYQQNPVTNCSCFNCNSSNDTVCDDALKKDCHSLGCAGKQVYRRSIKEANSPSVHIGTIASADTVMKSGEHRDKLAEKESVIGFEMEGAGVWDNMSSCIIIKGVCDYADSHKNKMWQEYAAAAAASGAKAFLEFWISASPKKRSFVESSHANIATRLQEYYVATGRLQIRRISGELLPIDSCYINLAIVEQDHPTHANMLRESLPFSIFARLKVEAINKDKQVRLPELFEPREQQDRPNIIPKRILIRGRAGVGKTTLCKKIVYDYLHHGLWHQLFDLLLWVPLRRLKRKLLGKYTFTDVFNDLYFSELEDGMDSARDLWGRVNDPTKKNKTLFVLDGLDEVFQEWDPETPMNNILLYLLNYPQVIITSRPYGINPGHLQSFDLELETIGFDEDQTEAYIRKVVKHDSKKS